MIIANPIYDVVFKKMMENDKVAKFFIGTLLDEVIETVEVKPQEFTYSDELAGLAVFRLDFIATIKTKSGELKKVLIEIQKAKNQIDLMRFRRYLAEQYKKDDVINGKKLVLPITTIYILGFSLPEIDSACLKVERNYKDLVTNSIVTAKSAFIEKLTHDCFVVQVEKITNKYQTKLDKLLSLFEQSHFIGDDKITKEYFHIIDNEDIKISTEILHHSGTDSTSRKKLEDEVEAWRTVEAMFEDQRTEFIEEIISFKEQIEESKKEIEENKKEIEESKKEIKESKKEIEESKKEIEESKKEIEEKNFALSEKDKIIEELMRKLKN